MLIRNGNNRLSTTFNAAMSDYDKLKNKCVRFRALIIGRPNAGKTTILRRIAQTADRRVSFLSIISVEC
jgi:stage III sporulation protein SpoIIIAA